MAFAVDDFQDLMRLLHKHPEWRSELRRVVLSEELLGLPALVRELAAEVRALAEAQRRTEERLGRLEAAVEALAEAQRRTEEQVASLVGAMGSLEKWLLAVVGDLDELARKVDDLRGFRREVEFAQKAHGLLGRVLRRTYVYARNELAALAAEALERGVLSPEDHQEILRADTVLRGTRMDTDEEVHLVVEVSAVVDPGDVERAVDRAGRLAKVLGPVLPAVAGERLTVGARERARELKVIEVTDGRVNWPTA